MFRAYLWPKKPDQHKYSALMSINHISSLPVSPVQTRLRLKPRLNKSSHLYKLHVPHDVSATLSFSHETCKFVFILTINNHFKSSACLSIQDLSHKPNSGFWQREPEQLSYYRSEPLSSCLSCQLNNHLPIPSTISSFCQLSINPWSKYCKCVHQLLSKHVISRPFEWIIKVAFWLLQRKKSYVWRRAGCFSATTKVFLSFIFSLTRAEMFFRLNPGHRGRSVHWIVLIKI